MNGKHHPKVYFAMLWGKPGIIFYFTVKLELRISMDHSKRKNTSANKLLLHCELWYCYQHRLVNCEVRKQHGDLLFVLSQKQTIEMSSLVDISIAKVSHFLQA